jgi:hypothetical protein
MEARGETGQTCVEAGDLVRGVGPLSLKEAGVGQAEGRESLGFGRGCLSYCCA